MKEFVAQLHDFLSNKLFEIEFKFVPEAENLKTWLHAEDCEKLIQEIIRETDIQFLHPKDIKKIKFIKNAQRHFRFMLIGVELELEYPTRSYFFNAAIEKPRSC